MRNALSSVNRRLVVGVASAAFAVLAVATVAAAGPSRSERRPSAVTVTVDVCSASPTVTWSGFLTAAVQVEFEQYVGGEDVAEAKSAVVPVSPAAVSGSVVIPAPAAVTGSGWVLDGVKLFKFANGKGAKVEKSIECSIADPTTTTTEATTTTTEATTTTTTEAPTTTTTFEAGSPGVSTPGSTVDDDDDTRGSTTPGSTVDDDDDDDDTPGSTTPGSTVDDEDDDHTPGSTVDDD